MVHRAGWLRTAVLGANDGIVPTSSLIVRVAAASKRSESLYENRARGVCLSCDFRHFRARRQVEGRAGG